jgi:hypothetical protein
MFSTPGAERGLTSQVMSSVADRMAQSGPNAADINLGREIARKFYAGEPLAPDEQAIFDEMIRAVRSGKAAQMLLGQRRPTPYDDFIQ